MSSQDSELLTFGGHLEVMRRMLIRIFIVVGVFSIGVFCFKDVTWNLLLAPSDCHFITYQWIEQVLHFMGFEDFHFQEYYVSLIATDLSSQFMRHLSTSLYLGALAASPYALFELFRFVSPALYDSERKYSVLIMLIIFFLFLVGVLMSYFILFPIAFRFLGTYSVAEQVVSNITIDSYISTFVSLTLVLGVVFQLPVIAFALAKMGFIHKQLLLDYRKHAVIVIMLAAAIITPPDIMTLVLVTLPLCLLYEVSIRVVGWVEPKD